MTEAEWLECTDPKRMLEFLRRRLKQQPGCLSDRKVRLYLVACGRRIWHLVDHDCSRQAIEVAELLADDRATDEDRLRAYHAAHAGFSDSRTNPAYFAKHCLNRKVLRRQEVQDGYLAAVAAGWEILGGVYTDVNRSKLEKTLMPERQAQANLVREIISNPFRPVAINSAWLAWNDGTIPKLAQAIYDERAFDRLPILADALEEAGCNNADILNHCRQPGEHVRGCWVVDALLGKS